MPATNKLQQSNTQVSDFPTKLSQPARRALLGAGYTRLDQLAGTTEAELKKLHGMGPKALEQLRGALAVQGLAFADRTER